MFGLAGDNFFIILLIALWTLPWKGFALWRAAHREDKWWFIVFLVLNLLAIPEIIYLIVTRRKKDNLAIPPAPTAPTPI